ncbi:cell division protein anillin-domain-containing protein [Exophiala viscosa]|uniref:cell division protein anillin-domain-containing protein n=1 Tax=Exophiala viscosa TaxID=2486360 RepID=UPI002198E250|nr:cell division protein anillin-domain-containing protein [Exophiala viscosa]
MASEVPPLRIQKGSNGISPSKLPRVTNRPLSELSPMALRRNSPSFPQAKGKLFGNTNESSPAESSPQSTVSPRLFWQGRDPNSPARESPFACDSPPPTSPKKRSSIENLKKASRVKNSSMFAIEHNNYYDPARPAILDGRPQSIQFPRQQSPLRGSDAVRKENVPANGSPAKNAFEEPDTTTTLVAPLSPSRFNSPPTKSSLSKKTGAAFRRSGFDPDKGIWEDDDDVQSKQQLPAGRGLHRHQKSVTFDQKPPQVNEYEMTTPAPSSCASGSREGSYESREDGGDEDESFERGSSMDQDDSFDASLEDADKTPVVLPDDWRFMSPEKANTELARHEEDVFDDDCGSPAPTAQPGGLASRPIQTSASSVDSNGHPRPLPPLPPTGARAQPKSEPPSGALERLSISARSLPTLPAAAAISKSDIQRMSTSGLSVEDRLRLMALQEQDRERRMRRMGSKESSPVRGGSAEGSINGYGEPGPAVSESRNATPQLSRASVLLGLRGRSDQDSRESSEDSVEAPRARDVRSFDPDVPIPSMEDPTQPQVKEEDLEEPDLYSIPDMYARRDISGSEASTNQDDDLTSQYSQASLLYHAVLAPPTPLNEDGQDTPKAQSPVRATDPTSVTSGRVSLPEFTDFGNTASFDMSLASYLSASDEKASPPAALTDLAALRQSIQRSYTPEVHQRQHQQAATAVLEETAQASPESVLRYGTAAAVIPLNDGSDMSDAKSYSQDGSDRSVSPPSDHGSVLNHGKEASPESVVSAMSDHKLENGKIDNVQETGTDDEHKAPQKNRVSSLVQLEIPYERLDEGLGLGLEQEFDRVVEAQKRGYLMRQNTKIVVASERISQDEMQSPELPKPYDETFNPPSPDANHVQPSPRKTSQPTWTAEPWNGKMRRKSIRVGGEKAVSKRKALDGPVPPLPGQASNAQELDAVAEDENAEDEEWEDGAERGRLFVKVVGVKDLQMPFPQHERTFFALTLDNGLHCVTTAWLDLARSAPIGQEFELVVLNELEFQLTLQMKLEEPKFERPQSPSKPPTSPKKQGAFGRLFGSPKKKKESELRAIQESQAIRRPVTPPSAYELVQGLVAKDGSFARAYVSLAEHEKQAYGRPYTVDITCFNEWAMEEVHIGSSRSKKGVTQLQRRPPYEIGKLELQLLYIPKPKGSKDEDMPKSMNGAIRALREADERMQQHVDIKNFEGYLSQQGGDCPVSKI